MAMGVWGEGRTFCHFRLGTIHSRRSKFVYFLYAHIVGGFGANLANSAATAGVVWCTIAHSEMA